MQDHWTEQVARCVFQPDLQTVQDTILPEAWFGFKELVKHSYQQDCQHQNNL